MDEKEMWQLFAQSGKVEDYLNFTNCKHKVDINAFEDKRDNNKRTDSQGE